jgi:hypothetical protein
MSQFISLNKSKSIGELTTEFGPEIISIISGSSLGLSSMLSKSNSDKQKLFDSENISLFSFSMKLFLIMDSKNMLLSSFSDPIVGEEKLNDGNISSLF